VLDTDGAVVRQTTIPSEPCVIAEALAPHRDEIEAIGLVAGPTSAWLAGGLREQDLPAIVINASHAAAALRTGFRNKPDRNDARGIADLMRVKTYRPVWVKSPEAQRDRSLLAVREQLRRQALDLRNAAWSILQAEGLRPPKLARPAFEACLAEALNDPDLAPALAALIRVIETIEKELAQIDQGIAASITTQRRARARSRRRAPQACQRRDGERHRRPRSGSRLRFAVRRPRAPRARRRTPRVG